MAAGTVEKIETTAKPAAPASAPAEKPTTDKPMPEAPAAPGDDAAHEHDAAAKPAAEKPAADKPAQAPPTGMVASDGDAAHADGAHHVGEKEIVNPPRNDPRFLAGSTGPVVKEGEAPTIDIPDGPGFDGEKGRKQNANDRKQNNYSVTDANFNPQLGLLASDPDTGERMTYVKHIQTYNAAGYVRAFAPEAWETLVDNQNAGKGTILGGAAFLMGLVKKQDPAAEGIDPSKIPGIIPGTNRDAREYVKDAQDVTGQDWARMHHPESAWDMFKSLTAIGVDGETALKFGGDDGVSGAGRLNGYNNQDGKNGFNAGEVEIWKEAAQYEARTGIPVIQAMMSGHDHTGLDESAKTRPNANLLLGLAPGDVSASPQRAAAVRDGLLAGTLDENNNNNNDNNANTGANGGGETRELLPALDFRPPRYVMDAAHLGGDHGPQVTPPATGDPRFTNGSTGPVVPKGKAATISIPDGLGFYGLAGREQNANDKKQNNYSVTDANFNNTWGILNDRSGQPLNYVMQIQLYHAAGYLKAFAPEVYALMVALQNAGGPSILELAGMMMGLFDAPEAADVMGADRLAAITAAMQQAGLGKIGEDPRIPAVIPGTTMDAKAYVTSPKDITGQDWARMHHPESAMEMLKNLLEAGVPQEVAFVLASDDGVSGAGRLNGFNNQDGNDSFNADEAAAFRLAAEYERQTGIPVVQLMMSGHDHTGLDASAKTQPNINEILGLPKTDVSASAERASRLAIALLGSDPRIDINNLDQFQIKNKTLQAAMNNPLQPMLATTNAQTGAATVAGGGAGAAAVMAQGQGMQGASTLDGGLGTPDIAVTLPGAVGHPAGHVHAA